MTKFKSKFLSSIAKLSLILTFILGSCEKLKLEDEYCPGCPAPQAQGCLFSPIICEIQDSLSKVLDSELRMRKNFPMPDPNQTEELGQVIENVDQLKRCETKSLKSTSKEHGAILVPNPAQGLPISFVYYLNSLLDGGNQTIRNGIGGRRNITLFSGPYSKSIKCGPEQDSIYDAVTTLQQSIPKSSQNTTILVEEVYSAYQAAAHFGASYNSKFFDIAGSVDYQSSGFSHKYLVMVKVSDFAVRVEEPARAFDWFPNLRDYSLLGSYSPVYVSSIEYGKMLILAIETNLSKRSISSALNAAFDGAFSSGKFDASGEYAGVEAQSKITIQAVGGQLQDIVGFVAGGKAGLQQYIENTAKDTKGALAQPLFVEFKFLKDNSVAKVVFATDEYKIRNCYTAGTNEYELKFGPTDDFVFLPSVTQGDVCFGHGPYEIVGQVELVAKNRYEVWAKIKLLEREGSQGVYGDTRAEVQKEVLLGKVPPEKGEIVSFVNDYQDIASIPLPAPDPHRTYGFDFNEPNSVIARLEAPNARDCWGSYPNDFPARTPDRNFVRIFFKNVVIKTKKP